MRICFSPWSLVVKGVCWKSLLGLRLESEMVEGLVVRSVVWVRVWSGGQGGGVGRPRESGFISMTPCCNLVFLVY